MIDGTKPPSFLGDPNDPFGNMSSEDKKKVAKMFDSIKFELDKSFRRAILFGTGGDINDNINDFKP